MFVFASLAVVAASQDVFLANTVNASSLVQYTPDPADWTLIQQAVLGDHRTTAHDPDSIGWIPKSSWDAAKWDGVPIDSCVVSRGELWEFFCPEKNVLRGLREVFYEHKPFKDNVNPTKAEVDEWHRIAINHVRALVGYTEPERQVKPDHCLFAEALWSSDRKFSTLWDAKYPGKLDSGEGPCKQPNNWLGGGAGCGSKFFPSLEDQAPYLPYGYGSCNTRAQTPKADDAPLGHPWSIKFVPALCHSIFKEGVGGHTTPWFLREKFGLSFVSGKMSFPGGNFGLSVAKWAGNQLRNKCGNNITGQ